MTSVEIVKCAVQVCTYCMMAAMFVVTRQTLLNLALRPQSFLNQELGIGVAAAR